MAIRNIIRDGKKLFEVYVNGFNSRGTRVQRKRSNIETLRKAEVIEFELKRELAILSESKVEARRAICTGNVSSWLSGNPPGSVFTKWPRCYFFRYTHEMCPTMFSNVLRGRKSNRFFEPSRYLQIFCTQGKSRYEFPFGQVSLYSFSDSSSTRIELPHSESLSVTPS
jgi:hypothetical protein